MDLPDQRPNQAVKPMSFRGRASARGGLFFAVAFFLVMTFATLGLLLMKPFWVGALAVIVPGCLVWGFMLRMTFQGLAATSLAITLDAEGFTLHRGGDAKQIRWTEFAGVTDGYRGVEEIKLQLRNGPAIRFPLFYIEDGRELGRILRQIGGGAPVAEVLKSEAAAADPDWRRDGVAATQPSLVSPRPRLEAAHRFPPKGTAWLQPVVGILFFSAMTAGGVYTIATAITNGQRGVGVFFILLFGLFLIVSIATLVLSRTAYVVDAIGIQAISPFSSQRMDWGEVESGNRSGSDMSTYKLQAGDRIMRIETSMLVDGPGLIALVDSQLATVKSKGLDLVAGRSFGMDRTMKAFTIVLFGVIGPLMLWAAVYAFQGGMSRRNHPEDGSAGVIMGALFLLCGALLIGLLPAVVMRRYVPHAHSLEAHGARGTRNLDYDRMTRVELGVRRQPKTGNLIRTMRLEHPDGGIMIDSNIEDFGALQDYILAHVNPRIVRDQSGSDSS